MFATKDLPRGHVTTYFAVLTLLVAVSLFCSLTGRGDNSFLIIFLVIFMPIFMAESVRASAKTVAPASRKIMLTSPLPPDAAFAKLAAAKLGGRCKVKETDAARRAVVMSSPIYGWSLGFHYPVFVRAEGAGSAIEVGILPRTIQHERTVSEWHKICVAEIEKALAA